MEYFRYSYTHNVYNTHFENNIIVLTDRLVGVGLVAVFFFVGKFNSLLVELFGLFFYFRFCAS